MRPVLKDVWKKSRRRRNRRRSRRKTYLSVELLEERTLLACNIAKDVADGVHGVLKGLSNQLYGASLTVGELPVVGGKLQSLSTDLANELEKARANLIDGNPGKLEKELATAKFDDDGMRAALVAVLGPEGPVPLLIDTDNDNDFAEEITLNVDAGTCGLDVKMPLGQSFDLTEQEFYFDVGLDALPFEVKSAAKFKLAVNYVFLLDLEVKEVKKDGKTEHEFIWDTTNKDELTVGVTATIQNQNGPEFEATIGFLDVKLDDGHSKDATKHTSLSVGINIDVAGDPQANTLTISSTLQPQPKAEIYLQAATNISQDFPSISADFVMQWHGSDLNDPEPEVKFDNVTMGLGNVISEFIGPIVEFIDPILEPIRPVLEFLDTDVPILSDLSEAAVGVPVSVLEIAGAGVGTNAFGSYTELIGLSRTVAQILIFIDKFEIDNAGNVEINVGTFNLTKDKNGDLRKKAAAELLSKSNKFGKDLTDLATTELGVDLSNVAGALAKTEFGKTEIGKALVDSLNDASGINYSFPFLENPELVFKLFVGQDFDLFTFKLIVNPNSSQFDQAFGVPMGLDIGMKGKLEPYIKIELGYDTLGLRNFFKNNGDVTYLMDGFWFSDDTKASLDASVVAFAGIDTLFFDAGVSGGVTANIGVAMTNASNQSDIDGNPGKVRIEELGDCLFDVHGSLNAVLEAFVKIGVDIPIIGFVGHEETFTIAKEELLSYNNGCAVDAPNPFKIKLPAQLAGLSGGQEVKPGPDPLKQFIVNPAGQLTLNIGPNSSHRNKIVVGKSTVVDKLDGAESYTITHLEPNQVEDKPNPLPEGEILLINAFGRSEVYFGVKSISGDAGSLADSIKVGANVQSPVNLSGGNDNDQLIHLGQGAATLLGGAGDDKLVGGTGQNLLNGGDGNDHVVSNAKENVSSQLFGEQGNDYLAGGSGPNVIFGGFGDDEIVAGLMNDLLDGGDGNDLIDVGPGDSTVNAGAGDDQISWQAGGDPDAENSLPPDGNLTIHGGTNSLNKPNNGNGLQQSGDSIGIKGSPVADTFNLGDLGQGKTSLSIQMGNSGEFRQIVLEGVENVAMDGLRGADTTVINPLFGAITEITVNPSDLINPDNAVDLVIVHGTELADTWTVETEQVGTQIETTKIGDDLAIAKETFGGSMKISGMSDYVVHAMNFGDDLRVMTHDGPDNVVVRSITGPTLIDTGSQSDSIHVKGAKVGDYLDKLTVEAGGGANSLHVDQTFSADVTNLTLTATDVKGTLFPGIDFGATGGDFSAGIKLTGGMDKDEIHVQATLPGVTTEIYGGPNDDTITVSSDANLELGHLSTIQGLLKIFTGPGQNQLIVGDKASANGNANVVIGSVSIYGLAGPGDATPILFTSAGGALALTIHSSNSQTSHEVFFVDNPQAALTLNSYDGDEIVNVVGVLDEATINAGAGKETINVGDKPSQPGGTVNSVKGSLTIDGGPGGAILSLTDTSDGFPNKVTLTDATIGAEAGDTFFGSSQAGVTYQNVDHINLFAGQGNDLIDVHSTNASTTVFLGSGGGHDGFLFDSNGQTAGGHVENVVSDVEIDGGPGFNSLTIQDSDDSTTDTVTVTPTLPQAGQIGKAVGDDLFGVGGSLFFQGIYEATLTTGTGADVIQLTPAPGPVGTAFTVNGNTPGPSNATSDLLNLDLTGLVAPTLTLTDFGGGELGSASHLPVLYSGIEVVADPAGGVPVDLILDTNYAPFGGNDAFLDRIEATSGQLGGRKTLNLMVNAQPAFVGNEAMVNSLTIVGSGDPDTLAVLETPDGLPQFAGSSPFGHTNAHFTDSGLAPNNVSVHFNGGPGAANDRYEVALSSAVNVNIFQDKAGIPNSGVVNHERHFTLSYESLTPIHVEGAGGTLNIDAGALTEMTEMLLWETGSSASQVDGDGGFETTSFDGFTEANVFPPDGIEPVIKKGVIVNSIGDGSDTNPGDGIVETAPGNGEVTLRAAIEEANAGDVDFIYFNIPGSGPHVIQPTSLLPPVTDPVVIDAYTQPGASPNTLPIEAGTNAQILVELNGGLLRETSPGLVLYADDSTLRGLSITGFGYPDLDPPGSPHDIPIGGVVVLGDGNEIEGNFIGVQPDGATGGANLFYGIYVSASNNIIGGPDRASRNLISGNQGFGIMLDALAKPGAAEYRPTEFNRLQGNLIGTDRAGDAAVPNTGAGVVVYRYARNNLIGGEHRGDYQVRNIISGNGGPYTPLGDPEGPYQGWPDTPFALSGGHGSGIHIENLSLATPDEPVPNTIQGNFIGTTADGTAALANLHRGVTLVFTNNVTIGGPLSPFALAPLADKGNLISSNRDYGIAITGFSDTPHNTVVQGNFIGTDQSGMNPLGNGLDGIHISRASDVLVGGDTPHEGNRIAFNDQSGIVVHGSPLYETTAHRNTIRLNSIHSNALLGIDLVTGLMPGADGPTPNDPGDADVGPNDVQNFPVITAAQFGQNTYVAGTLNSLPHTEFTVDFYTNDSADAAGFGEGQHWLGSTLVGTDAFRNGGFALNLPGATGFGQWVTATATRVEADGAAIRLTDTSEFSAAKQLNTGIAIVDGVLMVKGTDGDDKVKLKKQHADWFVEADFLPSGGVQFGTDSFFDISIDVSEGEDEICIDVPREDTGSADEMDISVMTTGGNDMLSIRATAATENTFTVTKPDEGSVSVSNNAGLRVTAIGSLAQLHILGHGGNDTLVSDLGDPHNVLDSLVFDGESGNDLLIFNLFGHGDEEEEEWLQDRPSPVITFNGGSGFDSIHVTGKPAEFRPAEFRSVHAVYQPGPNVDHGFLEYTDGVATTTIEFDSVEPIFDDIADTLTVYGTDADNAIDYRAGSTPAHGVVSVDGFEHVEFTNKSVLTLAGRAGTDKINLNNPNVPAGLQKIIVVGDNPNDDQLTLNGTAGSDTLTFTPATATSGTAQINALPVTIDLIESLTINGQGGDDSVSLDLANGLGAVLLTVDGGASGVNGDEFTVYAGNGHVSWSPSGPRNGRVELPDGGVIVYKRIENPVIVAELPPLANAGGPYTVFEGNSILLDGSRSSDPTQDANTLIYQWDFDYDGRAFDIDATGATPTFDASQLDGPSQRTVALRVTDSDALSHTATATVDIENAAPTAFPGGPYLAINGTVQLAGFGFDPANDSKTFEWDFDYDGQNFDIDATGPTPTFTASGDAQSLVVALRVLDDDGGVSAPVPTTVTVANFGTSSATRSDLAVELQSVSGPVKVGSVVTYKMEVTNHGPDSAPRTVVVSELPTGASLVSADPSCSLAGRLLSCNVGELPAEGKAAVEIKVKLESLGRTTIVAMVQGGNVDPFVPNNLAHSWDISVLPEWVLPDGEVVVFVDGTDLVVQRPNGEELFRLPLSDAPGVFLKGGNGTVIEVGPVGEGEAHVVVEAEGEDTLRLGAGARLVGTKFIGDQFYNVVDQNGAPLWLSGPHPWQNPVDPLDVNGDDEGTPLDILTLITLLNGTAGGQLPIPPTPENAPRQFRVDTNGDDVFSPLDVLTGIGFLNSRLGSGPEAEGEEPPKSLAGVAPIWRESPATTSRQNGTPGTGEVAVADLATGYAKGLRWAPDPYFTAIGKDDSTNGDQKYRSRRALRVDQHWAGALEAVLDDPLILDYGE